MDLGHNPPCDSLLTIEELDQPESSYPLQLYMCGDCDHIQINYAVAPEILFHKEYPYKSGITETLANNLKNGAKKFVKDLSINKSGLAIDIGSNDGTFLKGFKETGMSVLGIEPTDIAKIAESDGIPTIQEFFSEKVAIEIEKKYGKAEIITAANMFAHIPNLGDLIQGASRLLNEDGFFVTESHYLLDIIETVQFDSIYHEHLKYYSLKDLDFLFSCYDFTLVDAEKIPNYGGSIRAYAKKGKDHQKSERLLRLMDLEHQANLFDWETWMSFKTKVLKARADCRKLISQLLDEGKRICAIGCPGRSSTLLNYYGLSPNEIEYIAEQSTCLKVGMYCAGQHIPVVDEQRMFDEQPEFALMLSWHYSEPIIKKLREKGLKSKIIIPLPELKIVD
jgi:SAM-dependent methyltransferase